MIVAERSVSVRIHSLSPALVVYADRMRNPCSTDSSFSCLSASGTSPQSPLTCLSRNAAGSCSAFSKALSAPGVATTRPSSKRIIGPPDLSERQYQLPARDQIARQMIRNTASGPARPPPHVLRPHLHRVQAPESTLQPSCTPPIAVVAEILRSGSSV